MLHAPAAPDATAALALALATLLPAQDILDGRVDEPALPDWCEKRGWSAFLLSLPDEALHRCETQGLAAVITSLPGAPASLVELARGAEDASRLPVLRRTLAPPRAALRSVGARKQRQLGQLLGAVATMAEGAARIVDVGAGAGHFTRLAAELFDRDALGVDHDEDRLRTAATLLDARARDGAASARRARFELLDACRDPIALGADDLAVGLHACGAVGDRLVEAVGRAGCSLALVSCCFQKIPGATRAPLSPAGAALHLRREILGLASLTSSADGVETSLAETLLARQARFALFRLLRARGLALSPGEAMRGINRRRAHGGLAALAAPALLARGLAPATAHELRHHEDEAARLYGTIRRLSLPRDMLARLLEVTLVLDRAAALQSAGLAVRVLAICEQADTPRNVCIFASRDEARLPSSLAMRFLPLCSLLASGCFLFEPSGPPALQPAPLEASRPAATGFAPVVSDRDHDGVNDDKDNCPDEPEDRDKFEDDDGCPDLDNDRDGIPDRCDKCPNEPENFNNFEDGDGCPDQRRIVISEASIRVIERVQFSHNQSKPAAASAPLLDELARLLKERPELQLVACQGHTSSDEPQAELLGMRRAQEVRAALMNRGVDGDRLLPVSSGARLPLADNKTDAGRARNRRVEFNLMIVSGREVMRWNGTSFEAPPPTEPPVPVAPPTPAATTGCP